MKAAVLTNWENIEIQDVPVPELGEEECLIKVRYAGICGTDLHIYEGHHPTAKTPVTMGHEFVGTIEQINTKRETSFKIGDRVVVEPLISCGTCEACKEGNWHVCRSLKLLGIHTNGGFAEYLKASLAKVIKVDDALSDRLAAMTEPFAVGFHVNRRAGVKNGDRVLVIGGGPIGLIVGLVAREGGASQVVFSEIKPARVEQIHSFGFRDVINPAVEDGVKRANDLTAEEGFDIVIEVSGSQAGILFATQACRIRGTVVFVGFPGKLPQLNILQGIFKELTMMGSRVYTFGDFQKTVKMLGNMAASNTCDLEKLITDICPLEQLETSIQSMKAGKNNGKILIEF
ncbi:alcohol dehydrogenase catalytic domain-containing protein [Paenibacillus sp. LMG 31460]|uniref:Alcohol dehydrogenase catalytic domain-containing protein n=1 Tax=Paenibacillus germinis TaxID=2654979 RepID=A0ABX1YWV8_9BACL|nr:alcohol dehydrogenase catalytic domain-containing protein [Paenibacillus germinis]NOU85607.1 alcohol dehydrogenase catalytic domain-containing protein [Paenibacillus germinis]